jgi:hypothetical protein
MLMFFDETFRTSLRQPNISFGALCGVGIPERSLGRTAADVYQLTLKHLGADFARDEKIQGKELLVLSPGHSTGACAKEPQRREGRREKQEEMGPQRSHRMVTDLQAAQTGLSLRSSRLCGLIGFRLIAWLGLSA